MAKVLYNLSTKQCVSHNLHYRELTPWITNSRIGTLTVG